MKNAKRLATMILAGMMTVTALVTAVPAQAAKKKEGKVLNVYVWNSEFISFFNQYYPKVKKAGDTESTLKNGIKVKFTIVPTYDGNYRKSLEQELKSSKSADEKVDMFITESDDIQRYMNDKHTKTLSSIGISDSKLKDQFAYTRNLAKDSKGRQRAVAWQVCPTAFAYRRDVAKAVLGSDDPETVQRAVSNWNNFETTASKAKEKGYVMIASNDDTIGLFSDDKTKQWVNGKNINVPEGLMKWVEMSKRFADNGYAYNFDRWSDGWSMEMYRDGNVFGYFAPGWMVNYTLNSRGNNMSGNWAVCSGPAASYYGGSWICAAKGTDNAKTVKDIMLSLTANKSIAKKYAKNWGSAYLGNSISAMNELAKDPSMKSDFLGGQNPIGTYVSIARKVRVSKKTTYDSSLDQAFAEAFKQYAGGNRDINFGKLIAQQKVGQIDFNDVINPVDPSKAVTLEQAKKNFEKAAKSIYKKGTTVNWPK